MMSWVAVALAVSAIAVATVSAIAEVHASHVKQSALFVLLVPWGCWFDSLVTLACRLHGWLPHGFFMMAENGGCYRFPSLVLLICMSQGYRCLGSPLSFSR